MDRVGHTPTRLQSARVGATAVFGLAVGAFLFGILFGSAAVIQGLAPWQASLMSLTIYAGTAQFSTLALLDGASGVPIPYVAIVLSAALVTMRLGMMTASLSPSLKRAGPFGRVVGTFLMNDASWAMSTTARGGIDPTAFYFGSALSIFVCWQSGTFIGTRIPGLIDPVTATALAYAGTLFLLLLVCVVVRNSQASKLPLVVSAVVAVALDGRIDAGAAVVIAVGVAAVIAIWQEFGRKSRIGTGGRDAP